MTDFSQLLNPEQCAAATAGEGPMLVLAAAGTGKTRTLVHRVAYLLEQGVDPARILLLTFTNRAAREMLERAGQVVGNDAALIMSGTFHSVCARFLRRYAGFIGYPASFQILDEDDQKKLIDQIIKSTVDNPKDFPKKDIVAKMISEAANESVSIEQVASRWQTKAAGFSPDQIVEIAAKYQARKRELAAMDFDDLLVNGLRLVTECDRVREALQEHFLHVLVDEYQDTNSLQAEFTDILAGKHRNIMAVGDDFQCIYTWRGAQIRNIIEFPERWPGCQIVKLERNYRSLPGVLDVANAVMKDAASVGQFDKTLRPIRNGSAKPFLYQVYDGASQAQEILRIIREQIDNGYHYGDIAILYRSHYQSIDVQMALARAKIPFRITSGVGVFEQLHTKDVLSYLKLLTNPGDELSFVRFVRLLPGVGEASAAKCWKKLGGRFDPKQASDREALGALLGKKALAVWPPLAKAMEAAAEHIAEGETGQIISDFCDLFYEDRLLSQFEEPEAADRLDDIKELAAQIADAENGLEGFLADVALMTNLDVKRNDPQLPALVLSTVHQAKGMEWPVVMVPWCSEGMFPSSRADEEGRIDEERRLFYVAVTRAKDGLYLFSPQMRKKPDGGIFPVERSKFVKEIPPSLVNIRRVYPGIYSDSGYPCRDYGAYRSGRGGNPRPVFKTTWRR